MRVHLVTQDPVGNGRILGSWLEQLMWSGLYTASDRPESKADINLFWPLQRYYWQGWDETLTAGLFTHREENDKHKQRMWDYSAKHLSLRVCFASQYYTQLQHNGLTMRVLPPIHPIFRQLPPDGQRGNHKARVGMVGYFADNPSGRKGDDLARALVETFGDRVDFVGAGSGLPFPHKTVAPPLMPYWYEDIDILVNTSIIEGVGMPPLEALARGKPVVIPWHVGVWDDLGEHPYIFRYRVGETASLIEALNDALSLDFEKHWDTSESLNYNTPEQWQETMAYALFILWGKRHGR